MGKQKKNKDINTTILEKEDAHRIDKIDTPINPVLSPTPTSTSAATTTSKAETPVKAPIITPILKTKKLSLDSVDENLKQKAAANAHTTSHTILKEPIAIDVELFEQKWKELVELVKTKHENLGLAMSLEQATYEIDKHVLHLQVNSETTKELVEKDKSMLIEFISKELKNDTIQFMIQVSEKAFEINKKSLSPNDKLKVMIENNPAVAELIKLLNLEIDY